MSSCRVKLFRSKRGGDSETKRKNSNSDKEDADLESGAGAPIATPPALATAKNPEMQHRQRKQLSSAHNNINMNNNNNNNFNNNGCELKDNDGGGEMAAVSGDSATNSDNEELIAGKEALKMSTFHSSPALSASALSNQTNQTNCDDDTSINHKLRYSSGKNNNNNIDSNGGTPARKPTNDSGGRVLVHSASAMANFNKQQSAGKQINGTILSTTSGSRNSIDSITSLGLNSANGVAAGQPNGELKQVGGSKKRVSVFLSHFKTFLISRLLFFFCFCFVVLFSSISFSQQQQQQLLV